MQKKIEWQVKRMFAKGAFGSVFVIAPVSTSVGATGVPAIALKVFSIAKRQDAEQGKNEYVCLREMRAGRARNSVHAFGCCLFDRLPRELALHVEGSGPFMAIAMPFVDGTTLDVYLTSYVACNARPLPQEECFNIISSIVAFVVSANQSCGMVHGDLKPANIMRNPTNKQLYVIDLTLGSCNARPPIGWHQGTTSFMPPERLLFFDQPDWIAPSSSGGSKAWAGAQGDMWAVGVIMATVYLTGEQLVTIPEHMSVLGPGRRFDPAVAPTVYHLLWTNAAWYTAFTERVEQITGMDSEIVAHFYRLVLWRHAIGLQPLEANPFIAASPNFQVLQRFTPEAIDLYMHNAGRVYEIANEALVQRMGPAVYKLYFATQSLKLAERCTELGPPPLPSLSTLPVVSEICTHVFAELIDGVFKGFFFFFFFFFLKCSLRIKSAVSCLRCAAPGPAEGNMQSAVRERKIKN